MNSDCTSHWAAEFVKTRMSVLSGPPPSCTQPSSQLWNNAYNTTSPIIHHKDINAQGAQSGAVMRSTKNRKLNNTSAEDKLWHDKSPARTAVEMFLCISTVKIHIQHDDEARPGRHDSQHLVCLLSSSWKQQHNQRYVLLKLHVILLHIRRPDDSSHVERQRESDQQQSRWCEATW